MMEVVVLNQYHICNNAYFEEKKMAPFVRF